MLREGHEVKPCSPQKCRNADPAEAAINEELR